MAAKSVERREVIENKLASSSSTSFATPAQGPSAPKKAKRGRLSIHTSHESGAPTAQRREPALACLNGPSMGS